MSLIQNLKDSFRELFTDVCVFSFSTPSPLSLSVFFRTSNFIILQLLSWTGPRLQYGRRTSVDIVSREKLWWDLRCDKKADNNICTIESSRDRFLNMTPETLDKVVVVCYSGRKRLFRFLGRETLDKGTGRVCFDFIVKLFLSSRFMTEEKWKGQPLLVQRPVDSHSTRDPVSDPQIRRGPSLFVKMSV